MSQLEDPQGRDKRFFFPQVCSVFRPSTDGTQAAHTEDGPAWLQGKNKEGRALHGLTPGSVPGTVLNTFQIATLSLSGRA